MKKLFILALLLLSFSDCKKEDCRICTTFAPETLIIRSFEVCGGHDIVTWDGKIDSMIIQGHLVIATTTCKKF
jgi:hypothetical protein